MNTELSPYLEQIYKAFDVIAENMILMKDVLKTWDQATQTSATPATPAAKTPAAPAQVSLDDLKTRLADFVLQDQATNQALLAQILQDHGAANVSALKPEDYASVIARIEAA